jgi:GTP-binding protein
MSNSKSSSTTSLYMSVSGTGGKNLKTILGENIVRCRDFKIDGMKTYEFLGSFLSSREMPFCGVPEIAFLGRSNVGKSSLLNCISNAQKKLAVTSKTAGRTQAVNLFKCSDEVDPICIFADLPGYGFAKIPKDKQKEISINVEKYLVERAGLKRVMVLLDARREPLEADYEMIEVSMNLS